MMPSKNCYDLIKKFEGLELTSYQDTGGVWTIGYGTIKYETGKSVTEGETITLERASELLEWEINSKTEGVNRIGLPGLTQNQFDALCCFAYNIGTGALKNSTLVKLIRGHASEPQIRDQWLKWSYDNGKFVQGLQNRRKQEADLFFSK